MKRIIASFILVAMLTLMIPVGRAEAFPIWSLLLPLAGAFLTQAMNPEKHDVFMATAPGVMLQTPTGEYLPPHLSLRQQALILRKGVRIAKIKVGSNGNPLQKVEWFIDGDRTSLIKIEKPPYWVGTDAGHEIFDTANPFWRAGEIYYIGFRAKSDRDEDVDGEHPGFNCIPVVILDDQPFQRAATDPNYRQYLAESMGSLPSIPISRHVDSNGVVGFSVGDGRGEPAVPTSLMPGTVLPGPSGLALPNSPVLAQQRDGLRMQASLRGVAVTGNEIHLTRAEAQHVSLVFWAGELTTKTVVVVQGLAKDYSAVKEERRREITLKNFPTGKFQVSAQAQGADGSVGEPLVLTVVIRK